MVNYLVEGAVNFYEELYKSLDIEDDKNEIEQVCLITNLPLTNFHVSLECGHKFNYEPLYNDILNHKSKFNNMERCMLKALEIRCPYCRKIQKKMLPYYQELGFKKIHGVNYIDELKQIQETHYNCKWETGICCFEIFDPSQNIVLPCNNTHVVLVEPTGKTYCNHHKYLAQKQFIAKKKLEMKEKAKDEKMQTLLAA